MSIVAKPYTFPLTGPVIRSAEINADYDILYNDYNGNITNDNISPTAGIRYDKLVTMSGDATITGAGVITVTGSGSGFLPVGTIVPFYDFGGTVTFNTALWRYCDGSVLAYPGSPLNGLTLPDLSGRYPVGFGTDGGGNIGTAPWATAAVGNAGNTVNLQHSHTVDAHHHTGPSHTHTIAAHNHSTADHVLDITEIPSHTHDVTWYTVAGATPGPTGDVANGGPNTSATSATGGGLGHNHGNTGNTSLTTDAAGAGNTGDTSPGTNNQLSSTQNIQPSSIRVRYIIKVL